MVVSLLLIVVFVLLLLVIIWLPFLGQNNRPVQPSVRDETNVALYKEHKAEIEQDFEQGKIDQENFDYLMEELNRGLLQDIEENENKQPEAEGNIAITWPVVTSLFVIVFSFAVYLKTGAYEGVELAAQVNSGQMSEQQGHQNLTADQQALVRVRQLKMLTEQEPENGEAWYMLGQALVGAGEFLEAAAAFDKVIAIDGEHADLYGAKAQAMFYAENQEITPPVQALVDKALALDPLDPSTNILLGMHEFMHQNYQGAIDFWQKVIDSGRESVNIEALQGAVAEAKSRMAMAGQEVAPTPEVIDGPQLQIEVSLSDEILEKLMAGSDRVVFVYATPSGGGRMPLAAVKLQASDLPAVVLLDDSKAMMEQAKLSSAEFVNIYAIVSESGGAGIKSGDYKAEKLNVAVSTTDVISLVVDSVVP
ncbi:c-type cytochrome biogenesis protein CcmI [Thalassotalea agarivorans]|uniref:Cytochrome c-type biogenesis protein CcmH n=1 Tax=Thalassotalea agarivorans TaxID=349064 RepID=A0A1H9Y1B3_THASX|nr:c-type cytochrome biogenesis protein CcmI [Thalassotalea agarivorans]SES62494.1 cytochrome c-type biogenesis protein CcmH [Thalassotalea agarivorans]